MTTNIKDMTDDEFIKDGELLQVGDIVIKETIIGISTFQITRVTKTLAKSKRESDGFEHTFKRIVSSNMQHPYMQWTSSKYFAVKGEAVVMSVEGDDDGI